MRNPAQDTPTLSSYPHHRAVDVVLRDGTTVHVRPVRREDEAQLLRFFESLSPAARLLRFFSQANDFQADARRESAVDYHRSFGLVVTAGADQRLVANAYYQATHGDRAESALAIADAYQQRGLGTILIGHLTEAAAANGIAVFEAEVLRENQRVLNMVRSAGFPVEVRAERDMLHVTQPTAVSAEALERFARRAAVGAASAVSAFLRPSSVAVIGASRQRGTVGADVVDHLLAAGFSGPIYPVNRAADQVAGLAAYRSVEALPAGVDLAVVAVPAAEVVNVASACGRAGIHAMVVLSEGFEESGPAGQLREAELLRVCRQAGMRLIGPNSLGIVNLDPRVRLDATFSPHTPGPGRVSFAAESSALGVAVLDYANARGLGLGSFVSLGNQADITSEDLLSYWETDLTTDVILLYLEAMDNPQTFAGIARRVAESKPIVAVTPGRGAAGVTGGSRSAVLLASSDVALEALFRQTGVIRSDTLQDMFDVAALLAHQPLPRGRRVAIVTNALGPARLCARACAAEGLEVPPLGPSTQASLRGVLMRGATVANPVNLLPAATAEEYRQAIEAVSRDPAVDSVIAIALPSRVARPEDVAQALADGLTGIAVGDRKPLLAVFMSAAGAPATLADAPVPIPAYRFPEPSARALAHVTRYAEWRHRPTSAPPSFDDRRRDEAAVLVAKVLGRGGGWLWPGELAELLACYGLPLVAQQVAAAPPEVELLAGLVHERQFGPVVVCATGGVLLDVLRDVTVGLVPLSREDAAAMVGKLKTGALLSRLGSTPGAGPGALEQLLLRLSGLAEDLPQMVELDCTVVANERGAVIADARARVEAPEPTRPLAAR